MTRQEAIAVLESDAEYMYSQDSPYNREAYRMAVEALEDEPIKHGHWIPTGKERPGAPESIRCSECGFWYIRLTPRFYCSNCGARMDEAEE